MRLRPEIYLVPAVLAACAHKPGVDVSKPPDALTDLVPAVAKDGMPEIDEGLASVAAEVAACVLDKGEPRMPYPDAVEKRLLSYYEDARGIFTEIITRVYRENPQDRNPKPCDLLRIDIISYKDVNIHFWDRDCRGRSDFEIDDRTDRVYSTYPVKPTRKAIMSASEARDHYRAALLRVPAICRNSK